MTIIETIQHKASFLNNLKVNEIALYEFLNSNQSNLEEVIAQYKPEKEFKPVNTLRFLIANELLKETIVNKTVIGQLKQALENRDVSSYYEFNDAVLQSLANYKDSKTGMFPNWKHNFKILFPFIHNTSENDEVKTQLNQLADEIISFNQLENVTKHIVSFQGSNKYGTDWVWLAILPESSPSVQYAFQIFINIDKKGLIGGIHKGHNLTKQVFNNQNVRYGNWEDYLENTRQIKDEWLQLNSKINFIFLNDEKDLIKLLKKTKVNYLTDYFKSVDSLIEDLAISDEEKLVFSISKNQLSFQVGKRTCLSLNKDKFGFITSDSHIIDGLPKEIFTAPDNAFLYGNASSSLIKTHYDAIKDAVESEIERENHIEPKTYDNSAFRKAVFNKEYRAKILNESGIQNKYYLVGAYWDSHNPQDQTERFIKENIWENGYDNKFIDLVKKIPLGSRIAIKTVDRKGNNMYIKAQGIVLSNLNDGQNLKVDWKINFKEFKVDFSGGYWDTITEVKKKKHINAIWENKNGTMKNVKEEFVKWFFKKPVRTYLSLTEENLSSELDETNSYFEIDIFDVTNNNVSSVLTYLNSELKKTDNGFFKFSKNLGRHRPRAIIGKNNYFKFLREKFENDIDENFGISFEYVAPLNQIFYGPPGTGKTYSTILEAAKIIGQDDTINYDEAQDIFNDHLGGQIEFITFHQNYSYEDFIQGLRPDIEQKELSFNRTDGVFTKMVINALFEYYKIYQQQQKQPVNETAIKIDLNDAYIEFVNSLKKGDEFETKTGSRIKVDNFTDKQNIEFKPINGMQSYLVSGNRLLKLYNVFKDVNEIKRVHDDIREAIGGCNSTIYYVALREFISFLSVYKETLKEFVEVDEEYDYENITYKRKKELLSNVNLKELRTVKTNEVPKYVIIIDEINRANISRVFGELITLIEKDKRSDGNIPLTATLPSGEKFIVPSNLYIIGTMNTADKSIALLDIALRRRFDFIPMYPKYALDDDLITIYDSKILETINQEIVKRKSHDFTIGHSYFMGEDYELKNTIDNKVIPLLLEYFMNDFVEVENIFKVAELQLEGWPMKLKLND